MTIDRHAIQYEKVSLGTLLESQLPEGYVCMKNGLVIPDNYQCLQLPIPRCPSYSFASACIHHQDSDIDIRLEMKFAISATKFNDVDVDVDVGGRTAIVR